MNKYHRVYRGEANRVRALLLAQAEAKAASKKDGGDSKGTAAGAMEDWAVHRTDLAQKPSVAGENDEAQSCLNPSSESIMLLF
jgi:hypothetical protein